MKIACPMQRVGVGGGDAVQRIHVKQHKGGFLSYPMLPFIHTERVRHNITFVSRSARNRCQGRNSYSKLKKQQKQIMEISIFALRPAEMWAASNGSQQCFHCKRHNGNCRFHRLPVFVFVFESCFGSSSLMVEELEMSRISVGDPEK